MKALENKIDPIWRESGMMLEGTKYQKVSDVLLSVCDEIRLSLGLREITEVAQELGVLMVSEKIGVDSAPLSEELISKIERTLQSELSEFGMVSVVDPDDIPNLVHSVGELLRLGFVMYLDRKISFDSQSQTEN